MKIAPHVHRLNRLDVAKLNVAKCRGVFGKATAVWTEGGVEVAIMARNVDELRKVFDKLKDDPKSQLNTALVYDVVYLQSQNVTLEDEEL